MADNKEMLTEFLKAEGYVPTTEGEGGLFFKKEGRTYFTIPDPADPNFFNLYSHFDFADAIPSREVALSAANAVNLGVKAIKVTLLDDANPNRVSFGLEVPLADADGFRGVFERCLHIIGFAVEQFAERVRSQQAS